jgi:predicted SAM-dependent methyltransferase
MELLSKCKGAEANVHVEAPARRSRLGAIALKVAQLIFPDRQFISILRFEIFLFMIAIYSKVSPAEWIKAGMWKRSKNLKINLGNGPFKHEGWISIDCRLSLKKDELVCDLRRKWPLDADSARFIFCEHVFEHFAYPDEISRLMRECLRVLQPGGVLRVIVPDAERYLRAYTDCDEEFVRHVGGDSLSALSMVNTMMRECGFHKYAYDYDELERTLRQAGFSSVGRSSLNKSSHAELNLDFDDSLRSAVSLYVEAVK